MVPPRDLCTEASVAVSVAEENNKIVSDSIASNHVSFN
jgi:protocadherin gamma subfamily A/protocadherin gamma subfamily B